MPSYDINLGPASGVVEAMRQATTTITNELQDLHQQVQPLMSEWEADAQAAYWGAKGEWDQAAAKMPAALQFASTQLGNIIDSYIRTDRHLAGSWGGYSVR